MIASPLILMILLASAGLIFALTAIAGLSRHKKAAKGELDLVGTVALVETNLEPEGSVMVRGELWRARTRTGATVEGGRAVRVVGASRHLLEVEPVFLNNFDRGSIRG
jgi:membrane-bound serine protease (ClpP class)